MRQFVKLFGERQFTTQSMIALRSRQSTNAENKSLIVRIHFARMTVSNTILSEPNREFIFDTHQQGSLPWASALRREPYKLILGLSNGTILWFYRSQLVRSFVGPHHHVVMRQLALLLKNLLEYMKIPIDQ